MYLSSSHKLLHVAAFWTPNLLRYAGASSYLKVFILRKVSESLDT